MPGIKPPNSGLTPEAAEALNLSLNPSAEGIFDGDGSGTDTDRIEDVYLGDPLAGLTETGDTVPDADSGDEEEAEPRSRLRSRAPRAPRARDTAKATPPSIDEWLDFFSRIVLRVICDWYVSYAFRGVDEDLLTDREIERLRMTDDERNRIAVPLAEISHKSKMMRKHGRMIVASGGGFDAIVAFGVWTSRVNRIARRYKPHQAKVTLNERTGQNAPHGDFTTGANGGRLQDGITIINPGS